MVVASLHSQRAAGAAAGAAAADPGFPEGHCALDPDAVSKSGTAIQFWHPQPMTPPRAGAGPVADKKPRSVSMRDYVTVSGGRTLCHDCGNRAKKECPHQRCRKCCKRSGLDCTTHLRSTWIPVGRRRERHQLGAMSSSPPSATVAFPTTAASKKARLLSSQTTSTSNAATTPRSFDNSSSQQDASFRDGLPRQVRVPAMFRCVRVTSIDDGSEHEYAYQASVSINGHMFRGLLYDQGLDAAGNGELMLPRGAATRSISDLHLGSASVVPSDLYNTVSGGHILGGVGYGNTMN